MYGSEHPGAVSAAIAHSNQASVFLGERTIRAMPMAMSDPKFNLTATRLSHDAWFTRSLPMLGLLHAVRLHVARLRRWFGRSPEPCEAEQPDRRPDEHTPATQETDR